MLEKKIVRSIFKQVLLLSNLFVFNASYAATDEISGIDKLVMQADIIAVGKYTDVSSAWDKKKIYTSATFQVNQVIKGKAGNTVIIKVLGGTAMHPRLNTPVTMNVSNGANFEKEKKAIVFLKKNKDTFQIVGMSKGNIPIISDDAGQEYMGGGIKKIDSNNNKVNTVIRSKKMHVDEFITYIKSLLQQQNDKE